MELSLGKAVRLVCTGLTLITLCACGSQNIRTSGTLTPDAAPRYASNKTHSSPGFAIDGLRPAPQHVLQVTSDERNQLHFALLEQADWLAALPNADNVRNILEDAEIRAMWEPVHGGIAGFRFESRSGDCASYLGDLTRWGRLGRVEKRIDLTRNCARLSSAEQILRQLDQEHGPVQAYCDANSESGNRYYWWGLNASELSDCAQPLEDVFFTRTLLRLTITAKGRAILTLWHGPTLLAQH